MSEKYILALVLHRKNMHRPRFVLSRRRDVE